MNKKIKLAIPFAVLAISCGVTAGTLTGCKKPSEQHTHHYEWTYEGDEHWKECPDDKVKDETTRGPHEFDDNGDCVCGAHDESEVVKYGTVTGKVRLFKSGQYSEADSVKVDFGDDDVEISYGKDGGRLTFTATKVRVGKDYTVKISKEGYTDYNASVSLENEGEAVTLGGSEGLKLDYDWFYLAFGWDGAQYNDSHVNEVPPSVICNGKTLNVLTNHSYDDVAATLEVKEDKSTHDWHTQGVMIKFEDGKFMMCRIANKKLEWVAEWGQPTVLSGDESFFNLTDEQYEKYKTEGLSLKMERLGRNLYIYLDGELCGSKSLPAAYADLTAQIGFYSYNSAENARWYYNITDQVEDKYAIGVNLPKTEHGTVTTEFEKYRRGDDIVLIIQAEQGYTLKSLEVGGENKLAEVIGGRLTLRNCVEDINVTAEFEAQNMVPLSIEVKGKKQGIAGGASLNGQKVTLVNTVTNEQHEITVANDKIDKASIAAGTYLIQVEGYYDGKLEYAQDAWTVTLSPSFRLFVDNLPNDRIAEHDYSRVNDDNPQIVAKNGDLRVLSVTEYDDVTVTLNVQEQKAAHSSHTQGIWLKFEDGKYMMCRFETQWFQYMQTIDWGLETVMNQWIAFAPINPLPPEMMNKFKSEEGLDLTVCRKGNVLYGFVDGKLYNITTLPEEYADDKVKVGFFSFETEDAFWDFDIQASASVNLDTVVNIPENLEHGTVTPDKQSYKVGDNVVLEFAPETGYILLKLEINGVNYLPYLKNGKTLTLESNFENELNLDVVFGEEKYVDLSVNIVGRKLGKDVSLNGSKVTLQHTVVAAQKFEITVADGKITKEHLLIGEYTVTIGGYKAGSLVVTESGAEDVALQYETFSVVIYDSEIHDFSHVNDDQPLIIVNGHGGQSLDIISRDTYLNFTASIYASAVNGGVIQGIWMKFEDGKYAIQNIKTDQEIVQYRPEQWGNNSIFGNTWKESEKGTVTADDIAKFNSAEGVEFKIVRNVGKLYTFVDGRLVYQIDLPSEYIEDRVQVGFFGQDVKADATWKINIDENLPENFGKTIANIKVDKPEGATGCTVTASKSEYVWGTDENAVLTIVAQEGYLIESLKVNGKEMKSEIVDGKLTVPANRLTISVEAKFVKEQNIALSLTVKGKKLGATANLATGTTVTFKGTDYSFTVSEGGLITAAKVAMGKYTVQVDGYFEKEITFDENLQEIVLEYDVFEFVKGWDQAQHDLSKVNDDIPQVGCTKSLNILTKDKYTEATVTMVIKDANSNHGNDCQGIWIKFTDGKYMILRSATYDNSYRLTYMNSNWDLPTPLANEINIHYFNQAQTDAIKGEGIELKLARKGAALFTYLGGSLVNRYELPESYAASEMQVGFWSFDSNGYWNIGISNQTQFASSTVKNETAQDANGTLAFNAENAKVGDYIDVTITPASGYALDKLTVNGAVVTDKATVNKETLVGSYKLLVTDPQMSISAEFKQIVMSSLESGVSLKQFAHAPAALADGTVVTLSNLNFEYKPVVADGKISLAEIAAGTYTVSVPGDIFKVEITVGSEKYETAFVFEADSFTPGQGWGTFDYSHANDADTKLIATNESESLFSREAFGDVAFTVKLGGENAKKGNTGIAFRFGNSTDGYENVVVRMEGRQKIQFAEKEWYLQGNNAAGQSWQDLIFFSGDNADAKSAEYLAAFDAGTLELTVVRKGSTFYVFLGNKLIGQRTIDAKYKNSAAQVGIYWADVGPNGESKTWSVKLEQDISAYEALIPTT